MKKINPRNARGVPKKSRHLRYNTEKSLDNDGFVRYHIVVVGDKNRETPLNLIYQNIQRINTGIIEIRSVEGKVGDSRFRYLLRSFDTPVALREVNLGRTGLPYLQDRELYERKRDSEGIENYVAEYFK